VKTSTGQGINAGAMRDQVQVQQRSTVQDTAGEPQTIWSVFATVRAEVIRMPGKEVWDAVTRNGRVPTTWKLRFLDGVFPKMRLVSRNKVYDIVSAIDPTGRREELLITAEELVEEMVS
jgi:head-tail adaptor